MTAAVPQLRIHQATGAVPWPVVLLEGESGSGRGWLFAALTGDPRVGRAYWLEVGESTADQYAAVPGAAPYNVVELQPGGGWADFIGQVRAVKAEAIADAAAGRPPVVLNIDTVSAVWAGLSRWAEHRARSSRKNREALAEDPNAEIDVTSNYWNDATRRWDTLMAEVNSFPGIVVLTAAGGEVAEFGRNGQPIPGRTVWRVEAQKKFERSVQMWIRLRRDADPEVHKLRSTDSTVSIRPGSKAVRTVPARDDLLAWLVFDVLKADPKRAQPRAIVTLEVSPDDTTPEERGTTPEEETRERIKDLAAAQGWDLKVLAQQFAEEYGVPIQQAPLPSLTQFLADRQQDAAHEAHSGPRAVSA
jgi:hypothetical protein